MGVDGTPIKLLKLGQFPDDLKLGNVIPLNKKRGIKNFENYRPI